MLVASPVAIFGCVGTSSAGFTRNAIFAVVAAAFAAGALLFRHRGAPADQAGGGRRILYYRDPMNPQITSPTPKKDPMGMDYVPVYEGEEGTSAAEGPPAGAGLNAEELAELRQMALPETERI